MVGASSSATDGAVVVVVAGGGGVATFFLGLVMTAEDNQGKARLSFSDSSKVHARWKDAFKSVLLALL